MGGCPDGWLCASTILAVRLRSAESRQVSRTRETDDFGNARTGFGRCENDSRFAIKAAWCKKLAFFSRSANMLQEVWPAFGANSCTPHRRKRHMHFFHLNQSWEIVRNCIFEAVHPDGNASGWKTFHPFYRIAKNTGGCLRPSADLLDDPGPERLTDRIFQFALRHHQIIVVFGLHRPVEDDA